MKISKKQFMQIMIDISVPPIVIQGSAPFSRYRGPNGTKCVIGHIIDDKYYHPLFEGETADDPDIICAVSNSMDVPLKLFDSEVCYFITELQDCHDSCAKEKHFVGIFINNIKSLVLKYNLKMPKLEYSVCK